MFSNFRKSFSDENEFRVPKELVSLMDAQLPLGLHYERLDHQNFKVVPQEGHEMKMTAKFIIPNWESVTNTQELVEMMYRTQTEIPIEKDKPFYINGVEFPIKDLVTNPLIDRNKITHMYISPPPFPDPFEIEISGNGYSKNITIQRQPLADLKRMRFSNVKEDSINVSFIYDERKGAIKFDITFNGENIQDIDDMIRDLSIFSAFFQTGGKVLGAELPIIANADVEIESLIGSLPYWRQIQELERKLEVKFKLKLPINYEDEFDLMKLYCSLIEKKFYKEYVHFKKFELSGVTDMDDSVILNQEGLSFNYLQSEQFELMGTEFSLTAAIGLFDFKVISIENDRKREAAKVLGLAHGEGKRMYVSVKYFRDEHEAKSSLNNFELMRDAEELNFN